MWNKLSDGMGAFLVAVWFLAIIAFGIAQGVIGYLGIEHHFGVFPAILALFLALFLRFTIFITVGVFFGAVDVLHWHWIAGLLFAAPGLAFLVPGFLAILIDSFKRK
jgi:hypothetical protein